MKNRDEIIESQAISLLKRIYLESSVESEFDYEIFRFLKSTGVLNKNEKFYNELVENYG